MFFLEISYSILIILDPLFDFIKIEVYGRQIKHDIETALAVGLYIGLAVVAYYFYDYDLKELFSISLRTIGVRWILHDFILNLFRGLPLDYLGSSSHSAITDKFLNYMKAQGFNQWVVKGGVLSLFLASSLLISYLL